MASSSLTQCPVMPYGASLQLTLVPLDGKASEVATTLDFENPARKLEITASATRDFGTRYIHLFSEGGTALNEYMLSVLVNKGEGEGQATSAIFNATIGFQDSACRPDREMLTTGFYLPATANNLSFEIRTKGSDLPAVVRQFSFDSPSPLAHIDLNFARNGGFDFSVTQQSTTMEDAPKPSCFSRVFREIARVADEGIAGTHHDMQRLYDTSSKKDS